MTKLLDAALAYAERGWPVFPCKIDKTPYTKHGVHDATTDKRILKKMWAEHPNANIGFAVGEAGMMTLDYDTGWNIEELIANVGPIPKTDLRCKTPTGGFHDYLGLGRGEKVAASASKLAPHVDVRSFNSYTLLPPSRTKDGEYTWESQGQPAYRTDAIYNKANEAVEKSENWDEWSIEPDQDVNIADAIKWLREEAKIAVEGQGGDALAFATAAAMKSYALSPEMAQEVMWEHWNPRCSPPWKASEIDHFNQKIINGYSYNTFPPGVWTNEYKVKQELGSYEFESVVEEYQGEAATWKDPSEKFRIVSRHGMQGIRPPEWLIRDFLPEESYGIIFGKPSTGKTFVALDIALSVATGYMPSSTAMWIDLAKSGPVLFVAGEGRASIVNRVKAWEATHLNGAHVNNFFLADPVPLTSEKPGAFLTNAMDASPEGYALVVIDTVGRAMQGVNENAQEHASAFTNLVQAIQKRLGASVLALHHVGHGDTSRARGSSVFGADADTIIKLERPDKQDVVSLEMVKQKDAAEWSHKKWLAMDKFQLPDHEDTLVIRKAEKDEIPASTSEDSLVTMLAIMRKALEFLGENTNESYSASGLAKALMQEPYDTGFGLSTIRRHLAALGEGSETEIALCFDGKRWRYPKPIMG